jgi:hypothetical protein
VTDETWRPIDGYDGKYWVSSLGRVRSFATNRTVGRLLVPHVRARNYPTVNLYWGRKRSNQYVHQLVAHAFLGPRPDGAEVRHLDGGRFNNRADNLAYGSKSENALDAVRHGAHAGARKTHCPQGHPYPRRPEGAVGRRRCLRCHAEYKRRKRQLRKAAAA